MMTRLKAYAMLTQHALDHLYYAAQDDEIPGCCPKCCAPCAALQYLDNEGILDTILHEWDEYDDGTKRPFTEDMFKNGKVDREFLKKSWDPNQTNLDCHDFT